MSGASLAAPSKFYFLLLTGGWVGCLDLETERLFHFLSYIMGLCHAGGGQLPHTETEHLERRSSSLPRDQEGTEEGAGLLAPTAGFAERLHPMVHTGHGPIHPDLLSKHSSWQERWQVCLRIVPSFFIDDPQPIS